MAEMEWELKAIHAQLDVFETLVSPYESFNSTDFIKILIKIEEIKRKYMKTHQTLISHEIGREIMKYSDDNEDIKLFFVIIITDKLVNGDVSKLPVFAIKSGNRNIFIDLNCTVFKCWEAYVRSNNLPACKFCFPVDGQYIVGDGQYIVGERLKINFASSVDTLREMSPLFCKGLALGAGVSVLALSFFFSTIPINHCYVDELLHIAKMFKPAIAEYLQMVQDGVKIIHKKKHENTDLRKFISEICALLRRVNDKYEEDIKLIVERARNSLSNLYDWIEQKFSDFFGSASEESQHEFLAVTCRLDAEINNIDCDIESRYTVAEPQMASPQMAYSYPVGELETWPEMFGATVSPESGYTERAYKEPLEASRRNNHYTQDIFEEIGPGMAGNCESAYTENTFENSQLESAMKVKVFEVLERKMVNKNSNRINQTTMDLLEISNGMAKELGKNTLKDAQDIFEALGNIYLEVYKEKMEVYTKGIIAYNQSLGIIGHPKQHFQKEAIKYIKELRLSHRVEAKIEELNKKKKVLLFALGKTSEFDVVGVYRVVGISGAGLITVDALVAAVQEKGIELDEEMLVVNESLSMITIRNEYLFIALYQELNAENTSHGIVLIDRVVSSVPYFE